LDEINEDRRRDKDREARRIKDDEEEIQILRDRIDKLEGEREVLQGGGEVSHRRLYPPHLGS
jgi:hypothetical protein